MKFPAFTGSRAWCHRAFLLALIPALASASVNLITWGPANTMVTGTVNSPRYASAGVALDLATPITATTGYTGQAIYGGVQVSGSLMLTALRMLNNHASFGAEGGQDNDVFDLRNIDPTPANNGRMTALLLWKNAYVPDTDQPASSVLGIKSMTYTGGYTTNTVMTAYFVLRYKTPAGFAYMISPTVVTGNRLDSNGGTHSIDATTASWYAYDPTTVAGLDNIVTTTPLAAPDLGVLAVSHAGLLFKVSGKTAESAVSFYRFTVTGDAWRPKPPFRALYNNDTVNVRIYAIENGSGGSPATFPRGTFDEAKLIRSVDEAAETGAEVDAYLLSPFATHVPLWQSAIVPPDEHFAWWKYAHPRVDPTSGAPWDLDPVGYYMRPDNPLTPGGDVVRAVVDRCLELDLPAFVSIRLNDYHFLHDLDARPGLWNLPNGGAVANDYWRYTHPEYRLARAPLFTRPEYRDLDDVKLTLSDQELNVGLTAARAASVLDWSIDAVRDRMLDYIEEIVENYPEIDGIELDFLRSGVFFRAGVSTGDREIDMTAFVALVRAALDDYGRPLHKRYWLSARVSGVQSKLTANGLDVADLAAAGVDLFVLCSSSSTNTVQQGLNLETIQAAIRAASPNTAVYFEMTEQAVNYSQYGAGGNVLAAFEWLATRQQLATAMHLAYDPAVAVDGFSLFNFGYYRDDEADTEQDDSRPPFDLIPSLKVPATVAAMPQHYFVDRDLVTLDSGNANFKLVLRAPTGGWTSDGRLRLVSANPLPAELALTDLRVTLQNSASSTHWTLSRDTDIPEPFTDEDTGLPQFRLPVPAADSTRTRAWTVPLDKLVAGEITIRVYNDSSPFIAANFNYVELSILP
jgi:hypothetical protein